LKPSRPRSAAAATRGSIALRSSWSNHRRSIARHIDGALDALRHERATALALHTSFTRSRAKKSSLAGSSSSPGSPESLDGAVPR
jgi:hypothetical protein